MKSIEERAIECCMTQFPHHETADAESMRIGYIKGATEQQKISVDKACDAYRKELQEIISLFNRLGKQLGIEELGKTIALEGSIKDFRKTIEKDYESNM